MKGRGGEMVDRKVDQRRRWVSGNIHTAVIIYLIGLGGAAYYLVEYLEFFIDDTFIHLRYSKQILSGMGLNFNTHLQSALGSTSPLWSIVGGIPAVMFTPDRPIPLLSGISMVLLLGGAVALHKCLVVDLGGAKGEADLVYGVVVCLVVSNPILWAWLLSEMELPLFVFLFALSFLAVSKIGAASSRSERTVWCGTLAAALVALYLARPEGGLLVVALSLTAVVVLLDNVSSNRRGRDIITSVVLAGFGIGVWHLWISKMFGDVLPATIRAKSAAGPVYSSAHELLD